MSPAKKSPRGIDEGSTLEEVATIVCTALGEDEISVVLSGGAAVSIYSENEYESYDLDFVPTGLARRVDRVMESLGFAKRSRHWVHPRSAYWVEFPSGPVAIGDEVIHDFEELHSPVGLLRLLHPTECVMDRLSWFIHDADRQCLDQAVEVARRHPIKLKRIERWAAGEGPNGCIRSVRRSIGATTRPPRSAPARERFARSAASGAGAGGLRRCEPRRLLRASAGRSETRAGDSRQRIAPESRLRLGWQ